MMNSRHRGLSIDANRWDEKAGLQRDALSSQVIDLWGLRPTRWLVLSTCADVLFISVLANRGWAMAPLSFVLLATILAAAVVFWMILNILKIPIFKLLKLS